MTKMLAGLYKKLKPLEVKQPAFINPPRGYEAKGAHWVKPVLVAEVEFTEWTNDGTLRHPSFQGLREDKKAEEVVREQPADTDDVVDSSAPERDPAPKRKAAKSNARARSAKTTTRSEIDSANVAGVKLSNPTKYCIRRPASPSGSSPNTTSRSRTGYCRTSKDGRSPSCAVPRAGRNASIRNIPQAR